MQTSGTQFSNAPARLSGMTALRFTGPVEDAADLFFAMPESKEEAKSMIELQETLGWDWERTQKAKASFTPAHRRKIRSFYEMIDPNNAKNVVFRFYRLD